MSTPKGFGHFYKRNHTCEMSTNGRTEASIAPNLLTKPADGVTSSRGRSLAPLHKTSSPLQANVEASVQSPSVLGTPVAVPIGRPLIEMPPPSAKRRRKVTMDTTKKEQSRKDVEAAQTHKNTDKKELFIHGICGRAFASRSKVKKHHWGAKNGDLKTTTGCWAKHKKPNVNWDEHPSCVVDTPASRTINGTLNQPIDTEQGHKAPEVPNMLSRRSVPEFPTLQHLPQTVAETLASGTATHFSWVGAAPYHSHRIPTQGSFDSLLTAVNFASQIDAPKPQGHNDPVVSHLDEQAAAADLGRYLSPNPLFESLLI